MTCTNCGAELPVDAKFCHACGTKVERPEEDVPTEVVTPEDAEADLEAEEQAEAAAAIVDELQDEEAPPTEVVEPAPVDGAPAGAPDDVDVDPADPGVVPIVVDETATAVSPALASATMPTPPREKRARKPLEERGDFEQFAAAVAPLLRAPRFTGNLLGALVALVLSIVVATILWLLASGADVEWVRDVLLPPVPLGDGDAIGVVALFTFALHQVPIVDGDTSQNVAAFMFVAIPIAACTIGVAVARRVMPCSTGDGGFLRRIWPFALAYGVLALLWSFVGAFGKEASHPLALLYGVLVAAAGAWAYERFVAPRPEVEAAVATDADSVTRSRPAHAAMVASRVFLLMLLVGGIGWLIGAVIVVFDTSDDSFYGVAVELVNFIEGGFKAVGFGVLAEGDPYGATDDGLRLFDFNDYLPTAPYVVWLVTCLLTVVVGGLFSGFAIARAVRPRSRNDHALYGAMTGVVWAVAMLFANLFVLYWIRDGHDTLTQIDRTQSFFFALLVGAGLGALGGLLAASAYGERIAEVVPDEVVSDD